VPRKTYHPGRAHPRSGAAADSLKEYELSAVIGDAYAAEWVEAAFRVAGISYQRSEKPKSALYLEAQTLFRARRYFAARSSGVAARATIAGAPHASQWQGHCRPWLARP
jgi:hypothetical protein